MELPWAEVENQAVVENNQRLEQEIRVAAGRVLVEMHVTDWAKAQKEDPGVRCSPAMVGF